MAGCRRTVGLPRCQRRSHVGLRPGKGWTCGNSTTLPVIARHSPATSAASGAGGLKRRAKSEGSSVSPVTPTADCDEELAAHGIRAAGLKTDEDCKDLGRNSGIRLTNK